MNDFSAAIAAPTLALNDFALVEASAGTGKTYNIQSTYLRLVVAEGLRVQNILVVTFTEAATNELRSRLRDILAAASLDPNSARIKPFMEMPVNGKRNAAFANDDAAERLHRIRRALQNFDNAPVTTIHGFCKRVLDQHAFECGADPDAAILPDPSELLLTLCQDWWRRNTYEVKTDTKDFELVPFETFEELYATAREASRNRHALSPNLDRQQRHKAVTLFVKTICDALKRNLTANPTNEAARVVENVLKEFRQHSDSPSPPSLSTLFTILLPAATALVKYGGNAKTVARISLQKTAPNWKSPSGGKERFGIFDRLSGTEKIARDAVLVIPSRKNEIVREILETLNETLNESRAITYDAMLEKVRDALLAPETGAILKRILREEYHAALVDEFQDTDPVQAGIFDALFRDPLQASAPLLCVGDPKQAIYAFRGGDVFTYYEAAAHAPSERRFHLGTNYRSAPPLVAAINAFFKDSTAFANSPAFANENIRFRPSNSVQQAPERQLTFSTPNGDPASDPAPLKLWLGIRSKGNPHATRSREAVSARNATVCEIARLLATTDAPDGLKLGDRPLRASDIAILTNTNAEAAEYQKALLAHGILASRSSTTNVFDGPTARRLAILMRALLHPSSVPALNSLNYCGLFAPIPPETLAQLLSETAKIWRRHGFLRAFETFSETTQPREYTASRKSLNPDADIALLHQLLALTNAAAVENREPAALHRWFNRQLDPETRDDDETFHTQDTPSANAVHILTVHKSKGLEFPIVFAPTLWSRKAALGQRARYAAWHASSTAQNADDAKTKIQLDLRQNNPLANNVAAERELFEENLRLIYVALTRAISRLYLFVFIPVSESNPDSSDDLEIPDIEDLSPEEQKQWLLENWLRWLWDALPDARKENGENFWQRTPAQTLPAIEFPFICQTNALLYLAARTTLPLPPEIEIAAIPKKTSANPTLSAQPQPAAALALHGPVSINKNAGHTSFSALVTHSENSPAAAPENAADVDAPDAPQSAADAEPASQPATVAPSASAPDIFQFPGGATTGECWHQIFQEIDFQAPNEKIFAHADLILNQHGLCDISKPNSKRTAAHQMIERVLHTPLPPIPEISDTPCPPTPFTFAEIPQSDRIHELNFDLTLNANEATLPAIAQLLATHWNINPGFIRNLRTSRAAFPTGWLTGALDLLFQRDGRFYIADWKSNRIHARLSDFDPPNLIAEMTRHSYPLQYLLYTLATHIWLRQSLPSYDYETHFGGIYYLFLRGIDGTPNRGIHTARPPEILLKSLEKLLLPAAAQDASRPRAHAKRLPRTS